MDVRFFYSVKSFSRCAQSRAWGLDAECCRPGPFPGTPVGEEERSHPGAVGFSSDTHLGRVCVSPDRARLGNVPVGSVSLLLCSDPGRRGVRRAPRVRRAGRRSTPGRLLLSVPKMPAQSGGLCCGRGYPPWGAPSGCGWEDAASPGPGGASPWRGGGGGLGAGALPDPIAAPAGLPGSPAVLACLSSCLLPQLLPWAGKHSPSRFYS